MALICEKCSKTTMNVLFKEYEKWLCNECKKNITVVLPKGEYANETTIKSLHESIYIDVVPLELQKIFDEIIEYSKSQEEKNGYPNFHVSTEPCTMVIRVTAGVVQHFNLTYYNVNNEINTVIVRLNGEEQDNKKKFNVCIIKTIFNENNYIVNKKDYNKNVDTLQEYIEFINKHILLEP